MSVWKPNVEEVFIIEKEGIIQSVDLTRTSVIDVWYEVIKAKMKLIEQRIRTLKVSFMNKYLTSEVSKHYIYVLC